MEGHQRDPTEPHPQKGTAKLGLPMYPKGYLGGSNLDGREDPQDLRNTQQDLQRK